MSTVLPSSKLERGRVIWLLEVVLAGVTHRFSSHPVDLSSDDGAVSYPGGLPDIDYRDSMSRTDASIEAQTASMEVVFDVDLALIHRRGFPLSSATAELSMLIVQDGQPAEAYQDRHVVIDGGIDNPIIGHPGQPAGWAAFTISGSAFDDRGLLLQPGQRISGSTLLPSWSTSDEVERNIGKPYPIPIGRPGQYRQSGGVSWSIIEGVPAYVVDYDSTGIPNGADLLLWAGCHVTASHVTVIAEDVDGAVALVPANTHDRLNQPISTIDISGQSTEFRNAAKYWIAVGKDAVDITGGGIRNPYGSGALRGAGDVCRWALSRSSMDVDHGAWAALGSVLNGYKIDTYINDPSASPYEWLEAAVLPILPISIRRGTRGLYPVLADLGFAQASTLPSIVEGRDIRRLSGMAAETRSADLVSVVSVEYAPRASESNDYQRVITIGHRDPDDATSSATTHARSASTIITGDRYTTESLATVYDDATAAAFARRLARQASRIGYSIMYSGPASIGWLDVGQLVSLTDSGLSITSQVVEIIEKSWTGAEWVLILYTTHDPARDDRG